MNASAATAPALTTPFSQDRPVPPAPPPQRPAAPAPTAPTAPADPVVRGDSVYLAQPG